MTQTRAERLAEALIIGRTGQCATDIMAAAELRRLAPMEAHNKTANIVIKALTEKLDMLLTTNKTLADASEQFLNMYVAMVNSGDIGNWDPETEKEVIALREALRSNKRIGLAGLITHNDKATEWII